MKIGFCIDTFKILQRKADLLKFLIDNTSLLIVSTEIKLNQ
jgi:hypothetical protein